MKYIYLQPGEEIKPGDEWWSYYERRWCEAGPGFVRDLDVTGQPAIFRRKVRRDRIEVGSVVVGKRDGDVIFSDETQWTAVLVKRHQAKALADAILEVAGE